MNYEGTKKRGFRPFFRTRKLLGLAFTPHASAYRSQPEESHAKEGERTRFRHASKTIRRSRCLDKSGELILIGIVEDDRRA